MTVRATSTGKKLPGKRTCEVTLDPGAYGRSGQKTKGQAAACPDRTRTIPGTVRVGLLREGLRRVDSNSSDQRQAAATGDSA
jgi:hypothetical protein